MSLSKTVSRWLVTAATFGALVSFGALFSAHHLIFDLISHFRVQYIVLLIPAYILAMMTRRTAAVLVMSLALALHGYVVTMSILPRSGLGSDNEHSALTVLSSNLLRSNSNSGPVIELIQSTSPDVIAFQEYTNEWDTQLSSSLNDYPYKAAFPRSGSFGIALYSKYPFTGNSDKQVTVNSNPYAKAQILIDDKKIELFAVHPVPPINTGAYENRNAVLRAIANETKDVDHAIVMGDFNATPWTAHYMQMTSHGAYTMLGQASACTPPGQR